MHKKLFLSFITLLVGCSFKIPEGVPTAMIRFTSTDSAQVRLPCSRDAPQIKPVVLNAPSWEEESPVKMLGTRPGKRSDVIERLIPAERELAFSFGANRPTRGGQLLCGFTMSFVPRTGEQYQAEYVWLGSECSVNLYRISEINGTVRKTELTPKMGKWMSCPY